MQQRERDLSLDTVLRWGKERPGQGNQTCCLLARWHSQMALPSLLTLLHIPQLVSLRQADLLLEEQPHSHPHQRVFSTSRAPSIVCWSSKKSLEVGRNIANSEVKAGNWREGLPLTLPNPLEIQKRRSRGTATAWGRATQSCSEGLLPA